MSFKNRDVITINDFTKVDLLHLINIAKSIKENPQPTLLKGKILASCFFEPSTRTRLSFEAAMHRLGGAVIGFSDSKMTSVNKGENLHDTMKMVDQYSDIVVLRHPLEGSAQLAADVLQIPLINAGDGANQHPTQTFVDLFTIQETQGRLENLHIAIAGDLKHGRTVHSLAQALVSFNSRLYFISSPSLEMPKTICDELREKGIKFSFHTSLEEIIHKLDIIYMTRVQEERFIHKSDYDNVKNSLIIKPSLIENAKENLKILHPLPRVKEIDKRVDATPFAYYFQQAGNGIYVRQALLALMLGTLR
jgi:aspartate carbamoyltransferase catalytic subunit